MGSFGGLVRRSRRGVCFGGQEGIGGSGVAFLGRRVVRGGRALRDEWKGGAREKWGSAAWMEETWSVGGRSGREIVRRGWEGNGRVVEGRLVWRWMLWGDRRFGAASARTVRAEARDRGWHGAGHGVCPVALGRRVFPASRLPGVRNGGRARSACTLPPLPASTLGFSPDRGPGAGLPRGAPPAAKAAPNLIGPRVYRRCSRATGRSWRRPCSTSRPRAR